MASNVPLFARQPIFDARKHVVAYELLFRHSEENFSEIVDGDQASSDVLLNTFGGRNLESIIGDNKAFINFTRNLVHNPPDLPRDRIVIEVLEDIYNESDLADGLKKLKSAGFQIALDDFFISRQTIGLVRFADIIKIDVLHIKDEQLQRYIEVLKPFDITLLAEKIEDYAMLEHCKELGFDLFQGYFLCKPEIIRGVKISANLTAITRLIATLNDDTASHDEIVQAVSSDAGLSYKILKLVNSAAIGLSRRIESLSQAVSLLGLNKIRAWATFILMASNQNKPQELSVISLCRAKLCELMGQHISGRDFSQGCFTVGLLSNLDSFLDIPMYDLRKELRLSKNVEDALIEGLGLEGELLAAARSYERGDWRALNWPALAKLGIQPRQMNEWYTGSIRWAIKLVQETSGDSKTT